MTTMHLFTTLTLIFASLISHISCAPMIESRDVWDPPVLYPHAGTVWFVGQFHNVTWDTSNPPADGDITDPTGMISLIKGGTPLAGVGGPYDPLAKGFSILDGRHQIQVPDVGPGDDYAVVLFGDSGNIGQQFTILK